MTALVLLLALGATLRTRRLLLKDDVGHYPRRWFWLGVERLHGPYTDGWYSSPKHPRRAWLANKIGESWDCAWCLPYWIGAAWLGTGLAWGDTWPWQLAAGSLALSYVAAHVALVLDPDEELS